MTIPVFFSACSANKKSKIVVERGQIVKIGG